jgi:membrane protein DedA with SNARE-associated domain
MAEQIFELVRTYVVQYGYVAVVVALLLENAGLPVPGETVLLLASFLAFSEHRLYLPYIILAAICAATIGDNLGYWAGHYGGRPLLERYRKFFRIREETITKGEELFDRYGAATIFFARFVAGMRVIAGPLAGVLRMNWRKFLLFNFLGAVVWVTVISCVGYFFGKHWEQLIDFVDEVNIVIVVAIVVAALFYWWRRKRKGPRQNGPAGPSSK